MSDESMLPASSNGGLRTDMFPVQLAQAASPLAAVQSQQANPPISAVQMASELDLERFATLPLDDRRLTGPLRCVLLETALTGIIRFNWVLLRPLVEFLMEQMLREFEAAALADDVVGPMQPAFAGEDLQGTIDRFKVYLGRFNQAPWTLQRLCEVLLAPRNQYSKLHKVAPAIEKCLMVTSEVQVSANMPAPPALADLGRPVNCNPPHVHTPNHHPPAPDAHDGGHTGTDAQLADSDAFTSTVLGVCGSPPSAAHAPDAAPDVDVKEARRQHQQQGGQQQQGHTPAASDAERAAAAAAAVLAGGGSDGVGGVLPRPAGVPPHARGSMVHHHAAGAGAHGQGTHGQGTHGQGTHGQGTHGQGTHGQGSPGAGISALEHMEEEPWPEPGAALPLRGVGGSLGAAGGLLVPGGMVPLRDLTDPSHLLNHHHPHHHLQHGQQKQQGANYGQPRPVGPALHAAPVPSARGLGHPAPAEQGLVAEPVRALGGTGGGATVLGVGGAAALLDMYDVLDVLVERDELPLAAMPDPTGPPPLASGPGTPQQRHTPGSAGGGPEAPGIGAAGPLNGTLQGQGLGGGAAAGPDGPSGAMDTAALAPQAQGAQQGEAAQHQQPPRPEPPPPPLQREGEGRVEGVGGVGAKRKAKAVLGGAEDGANAGNGTGAMDVDA